MTATFNRWWHQRWGRPSALHTQRHSQFSAVRAGDRAAWWHPVTLLAPGRPRESSADTASALSMLLQTLLAQHAPAAMPTHRARNDVDEAFNFHLHYGPQCVALFLIHRAVVLQCLDLPLTVSIGRMHGTARHRSHYKVAVCSRRGWALDS